MATQPPPPPPTQPTPYLPALILVDLQVDFSPPTGTLPVTLTPTLTPALLSLLALPFPLKIFTKDSHPPDHISFATNHPPPHNIPFVSLAKIPNPSNPTQVIESMLWPVHCVRGTPGWEFIPGIKEWVDAHEDEDDGDGDGVVVVVEKGQDKRVEMYSAFQDPFDGSFCTGSPSLEKLLREKGVTDVYVVGVAGDYCVKETAVHSGLKGFRTWVIREGVASVDESEAGWGEAKAVMEAVVGGEGFVKIVGIDGPEVGWVRAFSA
ncbi:pyrazinamidase/nicotinamidase-like protein [Peziza echinospora]|nr:pyrazinamidase/nicotinamidase-like protein [Peziza echinospora]